MVRVTPVNSGFRSSVRTLMDPQTSERDRMPFTFPPIRSQFSPLEGVEIAPQVKTRKHLNADKFLAWQASVKIKTWEFVATA